MKLLDRLDGTAAPRAYNSPVKTSCPICHKPVEFPAENGEGKSAFPFCSERCKLIDLGRWLDGKYQIPIVEDDLDETTGPAGDETR